MEKAQQLFSLEARLQGDSQRVASVVDLIAFCYEDGYPIPEKLRDVALRKLAEMRSHMDTLEQLIKETEVEHS